MLVTRERYCESMCKLGRLKEACTDHDSYKQCLGKP